MIAAGYAVTRRDMTDMTAVKDEHRVPSSLRSCHTALVAGYVIEGHVPLDVVAKLLAERPGASSASPCRVCPWARRAWNHRTASRPPTR